MKALNIQIRRLIFLIGMAIFYILGFQVIFTLRIIIIVFFMLMLFLLWWLLVAYMNYFYFKDDKGLVIKFPYFRKFNLSEINEVSYEIEDQYRLGLIFGPLYHVFLRQVNKGKIIISFVSKKKYDEFISIIESRTNLEISREQDLRRKKKIKKSRKFVDYVSNLPNIETNLFSSILRDVLNDHLNTKLNKNLPIEIIHENYLMIKNVPNIHCEGVHKGVWFQYVFVQEGILFLFDTAEMDDKYMTDEYIPWNRFNSVDEIYDFVIEAFEFYYEKVNNLKII